MEVSMYIYVLQQHYIIIRSHIVLTKFNEQE